MSMINQSALATAVINITGNTQGLDRALGETKKQMHGFMVFAEALGGKTGGFLANMLAGGGAKPVLNSVLGERFGGRASGFLESIGLMRSPVEDIDDAMRKARKDFQRKSYTHKMAAAGIQIGGTYDDMLIDTPAALASARLKHAARAPKLADSMSEFVPDAAKPAQHLAMQFGKLGAVINIASPVFTKLVASGEELNRDLRRASRIFGGSLGRATAGYGGLGSIMTQAQFAAGATGIGTAFNQHGVGPDRSASMSSNLAVRAGELAKSFGDDFDQVAAKIQSAIGGSNDALAEYGVILSDDLVRAKAFNDGLIKFGETMSGAVAAQARYDLIMLQTNKSVETAFESFFNLGEQWTTLMSSFKSAIAGVGAALSPIVAGFLGLTNLFIKIGTTPFSYIAKVFGMLGGASRTIPEPVGAAAEGAKDDSLARANDDADRAADIIDRERARQSSNVGFHSPEDFYNHVQKSIFGNPTEILKRQTDLLHEFLLVSEEQLKVMAAFGYKVKNGSFLVAN